MEDQMLSPTVPTHTKAASYCTINDQARFEIKEKYSSYPINIFFFLWQFMKYMISEIARGSYSD